MAISDVIALGQNYAKKGVILSGGSIALFYYAFSWLSSHYSYIDGNMSLTQSDKDTIDEMVSRAYEELSMSAFVGSIVPIITQNTPSNILICDGSIHLKSDYPLLWGVIADSLKDVNTFTLPDLRDKFIMGASVVNAPLSSGGNSSHTLSLEELPPHSHEYGYPLFGVDVEIVGIPDPSGLGNPPQTALTSSVGNGDSFDILPPFYALRYGVIAL